MILILALISCGFVIKDITKQNKPPPNNCVSKSHMFLVPNYVWVSFLYHSWHSRNHAGNIVGTVSLECFQWHQVYWDRPWITCQFLRSQSLIADQLFKIWLVLAMGFDIVTIRQEVKELAVLQLCSAAAIWKSAPGFYSGLKFSSFSDIFSFHFGGNNWK